MQLKTLQIQGFKSFPDKTILNFHEGITAVVGPNGSGKSNISDAMGWVMGEQSVRNLRGEKMEDVIFLGSDKRNATGFAYVALTFDNSDRELPVESDEVTISRKLYRSGESEYRINSAAVRLKDINELLMDTGLGRDGYSIIGQGRIDEIVSAKSNQRRQIFEEAAGISKFRYRKEEAEKKLQAAYENLLRLKDIIIELEDRVEPLKIQSEKAQKFLQLSEEKKNLEVSIWIHSLKALSERVSEQKNSFFDAKVKFNEAKSVLDEYAASLEQAYIQVQKCSVEIDARRANSAEMTELLAKLDSMTAVLENDILHNNRSIHDLQQDLSRYSQNQNALIETMDKNQKDQDENRQKISDLENEISQFEQKYKSLSEEHQKAVEKVAALKSKRNAYEQNIALQKLNRASSSTILEETKERLIEVEQSRSFRKNSISDLSDELQNSRDLLASISEKETSIQNQKSAYEIKLQSRKNVLQKTLDEQQNFKNQAERTLHQARVLSDMERSMEGFQNSVKQIMQAGKNNILKGIHGSVSQLLTTSEKYALAIETVLGGSMQSVIVDDEDCAKSAIQFLKHNKSGRATFLPITTIKPQFLNQNGLQNEKGFCGIASELISCDEVYRSIMDNLLGRIVIVENIDFAVAIAKKYSYKFRIVTLDGQLVNVGGSLTGGSTVKNAGMLSRRADIQRLNQEAQQLLNNAESLEPNITQIKKEIASIEAALSSLDAQMKLIGEDKIICQAEIKRLTVTVEDMCKSDELEDREYLKLKKRLDDAEKNSNSYDEIIAQASTELEDIFSQIEISTQHRNLLISESQNIQSLINEKRFLLLSASKDLNSLVEAQKRMLSSKDEQKNLLDGIDERIRNFKEKNVFAAEEIQKNQLAKIETQNKISEAELQIKDLFSKQSQLEQNLTEMRNQEKIYIAHKERTFAELQRCDEKRLSLEIEYDKIIARLWDDYELTRSQADEIAVPISDTVIANNKLLELKNDIRLLGSINVEAIEEYREVLERYNFLKKQIDDVENSRSELIRLIRDLTSEMKELFLSNFKEISSHFSSIFAELFGGGTGELLLIEPDDILNCGIDIRVQPPGKIIKNLAVLSGGEKALVAIAIYFSILKVKPSSFCILDEIEAALDEVNVGRYASYLRKLSGNTQFISITHRRGTMEEADVLYGVTMQEKGVSRLIELDVSQVESKLGIAAAIK